MHYTVIAYRWGWTNAHHYFVGCTADEALARKIAEEECDDRGGKYGVAVYAWADEREHKLHAYFASLYGEPEPFASQRYDMFRHIGFVVHEAVRTGQVAEHFLTNRQADKAFAGIPSWLRQVVLEHEQTSRSTRAVMDDLRDRARKGLPARSSAEIDEWLQFVEAQVDAEVEQFFAKEAQQDNPSSQT